MRKTIYILLPSIIITLVIGIMISGNFLKYMPIDGYSIPERINMLIEDVDNEDWDNAEIKADELSSAWDKLLFVVQFSSERDEINGLRSNIEMLKASIFTQNKDNAIIALYEVNNNFQELSH